MSLPSELIELTQKFNSANFKIYLVGGAVRDFLLHRQIKDWDFTTDATPEQILQIIPDGFYNNQFGTVGLNLSLDNQNQIIEITTMRREGEYHDARHPDQVSWTDKIEDDLARRDFTINAMALSLLDNSIIDPFSGQIDLANRIIKCVGEPDLRFQEDALRLLRAIRFASQLGFIIEENTWKSIQTNAKLIKKISAERINTELLKILGSDFPYEGIVMLRNSGLLEIILPELERCFGVQQEGVKHDRVYDIGTHSIMALKFCPSTDPITRFAALIHDIGKPDTYRLENNNVTFYNHELVGARIAKSICDRLKFSRKETEKIVTLVRWHMFSVSEQQTDSAIRRIIKNIGIELMPDMYAIREADRLGGGTASTSWRLELFKKRVDEVLIKPFSVTDLKVNGADVMEILQIQPSRRVGEVLDKLFELVSEDSSKNTRENLLAELEKFKN